MKTSSDNTKDNTVLIIAVLGLIAAVIVLGLGGREISLSQTAKDTITVSGTGEVVTQPDEATIYLQIEMTKKTAAEAQSDDAAITSKVLSALKDAGIKEDDIETSSFSLYPRYEWNEAENRQVQTGYQVQHTLKVKTIDTLNVGKYMDTAVNAGVNTIQNVNFGLSKEKQKTVNAEALKKASEMAKDKAQSIADSVGVGLGKLETVSESNVDYTPYIYYPRMAIDSVDAKESALTPISPQDVEVRAYITLVYGIR